MLQPHSPLRTTAPVSLRPRQRLGKYRIVRRITSGGFSDVYEAEDTIEGLRVALRVPRTDLVDPELLDSFRREVRLVARLEHPNVLPIKNADFIDGQFVVCTQLGQETVADALERRMPVATALAFTKQLLAAVAHAHEHRVIHCDIKPDNLILFEGGRLRLTDFGIAKVALHTIASTSSGTVGYLAPEHALGRPTMRSDVFATGIVVWEMLAGEVPEWPFERPFPNEDRVRRKVHPELVSWLERSLRVDQRERFADGTRMLEAFERLERSKKLLPQRRERTKRATSSQLDWRAVRLRAFDRQFRAELGLTHACSRCTGSVSESMRACPWCGHEPKRFGGETKMPARCPRCARGRKLDWRFCAWCYGAGFKQVSDRTYTDKRYVARCPASGCGGDLMPFMRYCPWCRAKVKRKWTFEGADKRCRSCGCGVASDYWSFCPWCTTKVAKRPRSR